MNFIYYFHSNINLIMVCIKYTFISIIILIALKDLFINIQYTSERIIKIIKGDQSI